MDDLCDSIVASAISNPVDQFCRIHSVDIEVAKSYLEAAGGNIKTASKLYKDSPPPLVMFLYEFNPDTLKEISAITIPTVPPNSYVKKSWYVSNPGKQGWPLQCKLCVQGMDIVKFEIPTLLPSQVGNLSLYFFSPKLPGTYKFQVKIVTAENKLFYGEREGAFEVDPTLRGLDEIADTFLQKTQLQK